MTLGLSGAVGLFKASPLPASVIVPGTDLAVQPEPTLAAPAGGSA
ncbi:hypothetical protein [Nostocoides veronense]|uniref:Uncharacterized protein n=1 Tax=Nostocoides veronense TaxID=330836 RepID=A0ABN2LUZ6_9MICO